MKLKWINSYGLLLLLLVACKPEISNSRLQQLCKVEGVKVSDKTKGIIFISDKGCPACNAKFMHFINHKMDSSEYIFLISAASSSVDISPYLSKERANVVLDNDKVLYYDESIKSSFIMLLTHQNIDTILEINVSDVDNQLKYLHQKLGI